jgi:hypothetical protein
VDLPVTLHAGLYDGESGRAGRPCGPTINARVLPYRARTPGWYGIPGTRPSGWLYGNPGDTLPFGDGDKGVSGPSWHTRCRE